MNKKKILVLAMTLSMVAILAIGGTLAYFTDREQATNVFSMANLKIDLWEDVAFTNEAGEPKNAPNETLGKDTEETTTYNYDNIVPGDEMKKIVTIDNEEEYDAYVTLAIKHNGYLNFNNKIDNVFEAMDIEDLNALGIEGSTMDEAMQFVTDSIWSGKGWGLRYTKPTDSSLRYEMVNSKNSGNATVLGYGYANSTQSSQGASQWNYSGDLFKNQKACTSADMEGNFDSIPVSNKDHKRVWLVYLQIPANGSFTIDLSTTCPNFITTDNIAAFDEMSLDIQAAAIQVDGFADPTAAFTELHETWNFGY